MGGVGALVAAAAAGYAAYVGVTWYRYGHASRPVGSESDPLLDRFIPEYEVAERHRIRVDAPAGITFAAAKETSLEESRIIRTIIRAREVILGSPRDETERPRGLVEETKSLGWGVLAEVPGQEIVLGAVTRPWEPRVVFRAIPPDKFAAFNEPGYVKIVWNLRADRLDPAHSGFSTETRVTTTDATARERFRAYWARFSPGIVLIRWILLRNVKREAERRAGENGRVAIGRSAA